jgi:putative ABC transport system permease protein
MFDNLIRYSIRSFKRQRSYIFINILGLSIGVACSLLIAFFVLHESSYDSYNAKKDRIFDLVLNFRISGQEFTDASSAPPVGPAMLREFPEIEDFLRMVQMSSAKSINYNNQDFYLDHIVEADSSFFNFFSIPVLNGDSRNLLNAPRKVVLSESVARRIFGKENPVNKTLKLGRDTLLYMVTGVMGDIPGNSHFEADVLISYMSDPESKSTQWGSNNLNTYLLLKPKSTDKTVNDKLPAMLAKYLGPELQRYINMSFEEFLSKGNKYGFTLQRLTDIHLDTSVHPTFKATGDPKYLRILGSIAILILIIAVINFTNLSTAQASRRAKEVGIKKIGGSPRWMLIMQFLSESIIMALISTIIGLILIRIILPYFNSLLHANLQLRLLAEWYLIPSLIIFAIIVGIMAGSYPAFVLSSFSPYEVLKGSGRNSTKSKRLRSVLVVFQFTISIFLIIGTLIMYRQIMYMLQKDPGFNKEQVVILENTQVLGVKLTSFKDALKTIPGVIKIANSSSVPGRVNNNNGYMLEGKKDETILMWTSYIDYDFLETYGMTLASGRSFSDAYLSDKDACLLNEAAIKKFNIDPEKLRIMGYLDSGKVTYYPIIGVVKNFVFESLRNQIGPFILRLNPGTWASGYISVRISGGNYSSTISEIQDKWKQFKPDEPFKYYFLDEVLEQLYVQEKQNARMAVISAILAIFIAALGLFGLTSYTVEQRTKEIGVRKAMGSSVIGIYAVIAKEVMILISIATIIACPLIYYIAGKWLENFYYRINPGALTFITGLTIAVGIATLTISYRILKAARVNPAQSLRYE